MRRWLLPLAGPLVLAACGGDDTAGGPDAAPDPCIAAGTCPPGQWIDVTPATMAVPEFGPGPVVVDPLRPSDLYVGGGGDGLWRSTDYGNTWTKINADIGYVPMGLVLAVAPSTPATVLIATGGALLRSTDGGVTFTRLPNDLPAELYSLALDPDDPRHLLSGLHEADGVVESTDGGATWRAVTGAGFPTGGKSWYPFFLDGGGWLAIAQDGGSVTVTRDGGAHWTVPTGIDGLEHAHGNAQIVTDGDTVFVPGVGGPGQGVYRSDDDGASFTRVLDGAYSVAWATPDHVYAMWGWACADCDLGAGFHVATRPAATDWTAPTLPPALVIGANHVAVTSDGTHRVFVGTAWSTGLWRYVEP